MLYIKVSYFLYRGGGSYLQRLNGVGGGQSDVRFKKKCRYYGELVFKNKLRSRPDKVMGPNILGH